MDEVRCYIVTLHEMGELLRLALEAEEQFRLIKKLISATDADICYNLSLLIVW